MIAARQTCPGLLLTAAAAILLLAIAQEAAGQVRPGDASERGPIHIQSDADFETPDNGVTGGSGTQDDPYIISGWTIRPEYEDVPLDLEPLRPGNAIHVENTKAHFRIADVRIEGAFEQGIRIEASQSRFVILDAHLEGGFDAAIHVEGVSSPFSIGPVSIGSGPAAGVEDGIGGGILVVGATAEVNIHDVSISGSFLAGIVVDASNGVAISNATVEGVMHHGLHLTDVGEVDVVDTRVAQTTAEQGRAVYGRGLDSIDLRRLDLRHTSLGIELEATAEASITDVHIRSAAGVRGNTGLQLKAESVQIQDALIEGVAWGITLGSGRVDLQQVELQDTFWGLQGTAEKLSVDGLEVTAPARVAAPAVDVSASAGASYRDSVIEGPMTHDAQGSDLSMEGVIVRATPLGKGGGVGLLGVRDIVLADVQVRGFDGALASLKIDGVGWNGDWTIRSVVVDGQETTVAWTGAATIEADGVEIHGGRLLLEGLGTYDLGDLAMDGGGIIASGKTIDLSVLDCQFRNGAIISSDNNIRTGGIDIEGDAEAPAGSLTIQGCTFEDNEAVLQAVGLGHVNITESMFLNNTYGSMRLHDNCRIEIKDNVFLQGDDFHGLGVYGEFDPEACGSPEAAGPRVVSGNIFTGGHSAFGTDSSWLEVRDNRFEEQEEFAMVLLSLRDGIVADNQIVSAGLAVKAWPWESNGPQAATDLVCDTAPDGSFTPQPERIVRNTFIGNVISGSRCHGMVLGGNDNVVKDNTFTDNGGHGLLLKWGTGNQVRGNTFTGNQQTGFLDESGAAIDGEGDKESPAVGFAVLLATVGGLTAASGKGRRR